MPANTPIVAGVSSVTIPNHLHDALKRLAAGVQVRSPRGFWTDPSAAKAMRDGQAVHGLASRLVPADHVSQLVLRNLAQVRPGSGRRSLDRAELTDLGREVAAMVKRSDRRADW